tara:strand:- start:2140 stop:2937 length:798 start_codon:yes stop_codon:yes gene_type:complete
MKESYSLVTGASSGIGLEISKYLAKRGNNIILTARRESIISKISKKIRDDYDVKTDYICSDLSDSDGPKKIFKFCQTKKYYVNTIINNAGYGISAPFHKSNMLEEEKCIRVMSISIISLTKLFIPSMIEKGYGRIMIVSSVAAFAPPSAIQSMYGPTKTFANRINEAININYNKNGIFSTAVCPGYTITNFHSASGVQEEMDRVPNFLKKSAKRIAYESVEAMFKKKSIYVPTKTWKIIAFLINNVPHSIFKFLTNIIAPGRFNN